VFVPYSICINVYKAKNSEIRNLFKKKFFTKHSRANDHVLWVYVLYERLKGENSFWYPYFSTITGYNNLIDWTDEDLNELQDKLLVHDNNKWKERIERIWNSIKKIIEDYPEYFPPCEDLRGCFDWAWRVCCTRGYAWEGGMLIPMADNMNHGEVYTSYESEEKSALQELAQNASSEIDYSDFIGSINEVTVIRDPRHNTNRLEKFLQVNSLPNMENIWETDQILESYRSSSSEDDERNIAECTSDEESLLDQIDEEAEDSVLEPDKFFMMSTGVRTSFKQGEQVLNAYGRLNNRNLLMDYGFAMENNRYDTVYFLLWLPSTGREGLVKYNDIQAKTQEYVEGTELYGLKAKRLNLDVFVYYREILNASLKNFPTDINIELVIIDKFEDILYELQSDFSTSLEHDLDLINRNPPFRLKQALFYRIKQKEIIKNQVKMLESLKKELISIQNGLDLSTHLIGRRLEEIKDLYPIRLYLKALESYLKKSQVE
jgi:hypothetical protein